MRSSLREAKILFAVDSKICARTEFGKSGSRLSENRSVNSGRAIIYYDAECGFCRRMLRIVLTVDHRRGRGLTARAIQDPSSTIALAPRSLDEQLASWHLQRADGVVVSSGAAIPELLKLWKLPNAMIAPFERFASATETAYRWIADHRVLLGRLTRWIPDLPESFQTRKNPPS